MSSDRSLLDRAMELLVQREGPLTRELLLEPGRFGLGQVPHRLAPDATTTLVCGYCSTGCGLVAHMKDGVAVNLTPSHEYPVNLGAACPKGWEALSVLKAEDRATAPLLRTDDRLAQISWAAAAHTFTQRFKAILHEHGPESVAFLGTGQMPTEELALLGAFGKFGMGLIHGDGNTRQCMATAVAAYKRSFGFDAPPYTYADFEESDVIVLCGSNLCIAHPIMWERVVRNQRGAKVIVVDPRTTETARAAAQHYALKPKSDLSLYYGLAHLLIERGWIDRDFIRDHTEGYEAFAAHVAAFTPERVARDTGLDEQALLRFAQTIHEGERVSFWWTMGINQSHQGVRTAQALIALALITGQIGRPGTGANSITGQCNAMGSRLFSNTTSLFGGREFTNPAHRNEVAQILGMDAAHIPSVNSRAYDQIIDDVKSGRVRGLWIIATNSAHSWIDQHGLTDALAKLDFLVVQDMYVSTETAQLADLVLPAAGWGEKDGTFINSERRIGRIRKVARAPGQALSDFSIFRLLAEAWGCAEMFQDWSSPEAAFEILQRLSAGRPCDITGVEGYAMLDSSGGVQWPLPKGAALTSNERRLFEDHHFFTESGRAKLEVAEPEPPAEVPDAEYPFFLITGRGAASQWHTQTRTSKSPILRRLYPADAYLELNPEDAARLSIAQGSKVRVRSRRGEMEANAFITLSVRAGQVFLPMHYPDTNRLTYPSFDPYSRQPAYKSCAVAIEPV